MKTTITLVKAKSFNGKETETFQVEVRVSELVSYIASLAMKNKSKKQKLLHGLVSAKKIESKKK